MIVVGGENLIDFVQGADQEGRPAYVAIPGGSPFNLARTLGRQSVKTGYLTPISTDALGNLLASQLEADNVQILAPRRDEPTSLAVVSLSDGQPSYGFYRDGTAERQVTTQSLRAQMPADTCAFHIGSLALTGGADADAWETLFDAARAKGIFVSLDPNVRASLISDRAAYLDRIRRMVAYTDLLKLSDEDLAWFWPDLDLAQAIEALRAISGAALTVVTKGGEGAVGWTRNLQVSVPAAPVPHFVDAVGAGDTFGGTLLARLDATGGLSRSVIDTFDKAALHQLLETAARAAAWNCAHAGCNPPDRAALGL